MITTLQKQLIKKYTVFTIFWLPIVFFSLLIVYNTLPYFNFKQDFIFITERAVLFLKPVYKFSFYIHIFAGMFCVLAALLQFSSSILKKRKKIHIWSGRVYVFVVLAVGAPTGLYMSFFAKGGISEKCLFMFMAISWFYFTAKGLLTVLQKNIQHHKVWMIRSYSMALTAVTFRVYYLILYLFDVELTKNYEVSLWMSVLGNIALAELIILFNSKKYFKPINQIA
jgi:Predicted membrane protein (DUF2306)